MNEKIIVKQEDIVNGNASFMFKDVIADSIDLRNVDISLITNKESMFENAKLNTLYLPDYSLRTLLEGNSKHIFKNARIDYIATYQVGDLETKHLFRMCEGFIHKCNALGITPTKMSEVVKYYWKLIKDFYGSDNFKKFYINNSNKCNILIEYSKFKEVPYIYIDRKYNIQNPYVIYIEKYFEDVKCNLSGVIFVTRNNLRYDVYIPNIYSDFGNLQNIGVTEVLYKVFEDTIMKNYRHGFNPIDIHIHGTLPVVAEGLINSMPIGYFNTLDLSDVKIIQGSILENMATVLYVRNLILHDDFKKRIKAINDLFKEFNIGSISYTSEEKELKMSALDSMFSSSST